MMTTFISRHNVLRLLLISLIFLVARPSLAAAMPVLDLANPHEITVQAPAKGRPQEFTIINSRRKPVIIRFLSIPETVIAAVALTGDTFNLPDSHRAVEVDHPYIFLDRLVFNVQAAQPDSLELVLRPSGPTYENSSTPTYKIALSAKPVGVPQAKKLRALPEVSATVPANGMADLKIENPNTDDVVLAFSNIPEGIALTYSNDSDASAAVRPGDVISFPGELVFTATSSTSTPMNLTLKFSQAMIDRKPGYSVTVSAIPAEQGWGFGTIIAIIACVAVIGGVAIFAARKLSVAPNEPPARRERAANLQNQQCSSEGKPAVGAILPGYQPAPQPLSAPPSRLDEVRRLSVDLDAVQVKVDALSGAGYEGLQALIGEVGRLSSRIDDVTTETSRRLDEMSAFMRAAITALKPVCPACDVTVKQGDAIVLCPNCAGVYHDDCWRANEGCATFGCKKDDAAPSEQSKEELSAQPAPGASE